MCKIFLNYYAVIIWLYARIVGLVYIVTCQRIARQRLDKHPVIRARNNRTDAYSSLLGNSQRANGLAI
jgi:hypothetical protein